MSERFKRQLDIVKAGDLRFPVHILGAGGIGSWVALTLAKTGCSNITVYDNDKVEEHNVASQFYKEDQLGEYKVKALAKNIFEQTGMEINIMKNVKEEELIYGGLVIITIDSMAERIRLGEIYKDRRIFIIDGRMGGLSFELHAYKANKYLLSTVEPGKVDRDACTSKSISFNCLVIAGIIGNMVRKYAKDINQGKPSMYVDLNSLIVIRKDHSKREIKADTAPSVASVGTLEASVSSEEPLPF